MSRALWKGSITFGLVNIAIQLETAVREKNVRFHILSKDGNCRLRQKLYCPDTGKEFDFSDTARGIEVAPGQYVLLDKSEIEKLKPARARAMEIEQFVALDEIDPIYFDAVYFVMPSEESFKAYKLFVEALKDRRRVALARLVFHDRQHLVILRPMGNGLVLHTMHFADEVLSLQESLPAQLAHATASAPELKMAKQLIDQMTQPAHLADFKDDYRHQLQAMIDQKKHGKKIAEVSDEQEAEIPHTINLMEALKRSLSHPKSAPLNPHRRKSA